MVHGEHGTFLVLILETLVTPQNRLAFLCGAAKVHCGSERGGEEMLHLRTSCVILRTCSLGKRNHFQLIIANIPRKDLPSQVRKLKNEVRLRQRGIGYKMQPQKTGNFGFLEVLGYFTFPLDF